MITIEAKTDVNWSARVTTLRWSEGVVGRWKLMESDDGKASVPASDDSSDSADSSSMPASSSIGRRS